MPFKEYEAELQRNLKSGHATEPTYYPALKSLLESLDSSISVLQNPKKTEHGSPDFRLTRKRTIEFPVGWIEAKLPDEDLGKIARSDQLKRYYHLPNLILTDFLEFRWYTDGKERLTASLGVLADGKCKFEADGQAKVEELLRGFLAHKTPPAKDSRDLAKRMAQLAHFIREAILIALEHEPETGVLHQQMDAFREALIPDLDAEQFADMYSQTIAYGLFAARCQPSATRQNFSRDSAARFIPKTNPFLQKMFYVIAGPDLPETILPYMDDLVALLRDTDIGAIMADFGKRTAKEDPVVHFYEDFLQAYDPKLRELRGAYYTPEPVVSYIVRSIDYILKHQFSRPMGLADKKVLILDPACGTGTFLYYVIRHIYDTLCQHGQKGQWNSYVSAHLLKRIFGFELLMAPYAVAHLKLGLLLQELEYKFESDERLGVYLTNTLEEAAKKSELIFGKWIADESNAASEIKRDKPIMVILGNPPYKGISANRGRWITELLDVYRTVDGEPLGEKKVWLKNDYVKFIRFGQWRIDRTGHGVLAFITDHSYLDSPTFRGMRRNLMKSFSEISILNLHGNQKRRERPPSGGDDKNVFDIKQGVAVSLLSKQEKRTDSRIRYADLWGLREDKYGWLRKNEISTTRAEPIEPAAPFFSFRPAVVENRTEYLRGYKISDIFVLGSNGVQTSRDSLVVAFDRRNLVTRIKSFADPKKTTEDVRPEFFEGPPLKGHLLGDTEVWSVAEARSSLQKDNAWEKAIRPYLYRPFDERAVLYLDSVVHRTRRAVMGQFEKRNIGLCIGRAGLVTAGPWDLLFCTKSICDHNLFYRGSSLNLPLHVSKDAKAPKGLFREPSTGTLNLKATFTAEVSDTLKLKPADSENGDLQKTVGGGDIVNYVYAILSSPAYRRRYDEFLKIDFPHVPLTRDKKLFAALVEKGGELVSLHLMESPKLSHFITKYEQPGDHEVKKVRYAEPARLGEPNPKAGIKAGRVYINDAQYFEGVPKEVWEFHIGGYQVCEKWLKDRKGRKLSSDDIDHYQKIVVALAETIRIMAEIDSIIPGWPLP